MRDLEAMIKGLEGERVLVFVQFHDLMEATAKALQEGGIDAQQLKGSVHQKTAALGSFQRSEGASVLLLNIGNESAAGANLTMARTRQRERRSSRGRHCVKAARAVAMVAVDANQPGSLCALLHSPSPDASGTDTMPARTS
jgi:uncharacterized protein GlcG (DUF336 family)